MAQHIEDLCEDKARAGDGNFAIAYALLRLAREHERLGTKVGQLGFDGPGSNPGALEFIGMQPRSLTAAFEHLTVSASVDINNG